MHTFFPGGLMIEDIAQILWNLLLHFEVKVPFQLAMQNPLNAPVVVTRMDFNIFYKGGSTN
jgi:hypothetical protein